MSIENYAAHRVYTGGQIGYSTSAPDVRGRVMGTVRALRAVHKFVNTPKSAQRENTTEDYDAAEKSGVLKLSKAEKIARMESAVSDSSSFLGGCGAISVYSFPFCVVTL